MNPSTSVHPGGPAVSTLRNALLLASVLATSAGAVNEVDPGATITVRPEPVGRAAAVVPTTIAFQGYLTDTGGAPVDGSANLELALYPVDAGGTALWTEIHSGVPVNQGVFAIALGEATPFPSDLFDGPLFLGVRVDGAPEMTPRTELRSTAYAFAADDAANLGGIAPDGYVSVDGDDVEGPLALRGGVVGLESGGITEVVDSTSPVPVRKYYFDSRGSGWNRDVTVVLSFNGTGETPSGGSGTAEVLVNGVLHTAIAIPGAGGRAWTYAVSLGTLADFTAVDVLVAAASAATPVLIRDISLQLTGDASATGNTLDEAYDEGGAGAGRVINATAGAVEIVGPDGLNVESYVNVGEAGAATGLFDLFGSFSSNPIVELTNRNGGGSVYIRDTNEARMHYYESDGSAGGGAWWGVYGNPSFTGYVNIDGNAGGSGNPVMTIRGSGSQTVFDTRDTGDDAVALPASAVSAEELLDEAGLSQGTAEGNVAITETAIMQDVVTTTITIPASGYIHLTASAQFRITSASGADYIGFQIDEGAGGSQDFDYYYYTGWTSATEEGTHYLPGHAQRTYFKSAGTYTFRLEARDAQGTSSKYAWNPIITAIYVPTSYGSVQTRVGADEATSFTDVATGSTGDNGPGTSSTTSRRVDLRELELRVAREEAQLQAARRALLEAELEASGNGPH